MSDLINMIASSVEHFDLDAPLTDLELAAIGQLPEPVSKGISPVVVKDLEEDQRAPVIASETVSNNDEYNEAYVYWTRCQALLALRNFQEGWSALEDLVLRPYLEGRKGENESYRGDDKDKVFSLRLKQQTIEDFLKYVEVRFQEAATLPRPKQ